MPLNIEQTIGQKLMISFDGITPPQELLERLSQQHVGGVTLFRHWNAGSPAQVRALTEAIQQAAAAAGQPPLLIAADQEGGQLVAIGGTTPFPGNMALGATDSAELAERAGHAIGLELAAVGVNVNYAPSCDVNVNPANPVIGVRSFGEDAAAVARLTKAMVRGMQAAGVAATAKHFPGHGDVASDTHHGAVLVPHDRARLDQVELPPFAAAIEGGAKLIMTAHLGVPAYDEAALPATLSRPIIRGLLREKLGFGGVVVSDAMNMGAIAQGGNKQVDMIAAVAAGQDLLLLMEDDATVDMIYRSLVHAAQRQLLDLADLAASAERILALKRWATQQSQPPLGVLRSDEHMALAREIAEQSVTLVRNDSRLLPLRPAPEQQIAVVVPAMRDLTPADTSSYESCSLADAVRRHHANTAEVQAPADPSEAEIAALCAQVAQADIVVVATINAFMQPGQAALVKALLASGQPVAVVALRLPYDLAEFPTAPVFACSYGVQEPSLHALAAALFGTIPWKGHLPVSIRGLYDRGHGIAG